MKSFLRVLALCAGLTCLNAPAQTKEEAIAGAKALLQRLFADNTTEEEMLELAKEANKAGVPRQQIIEAKLVWGLRHQSSPFLIKILPEVEILASSFDSSTAAALPNAETVTAFASYIKALKAGDAGDQAGFKQNILEAVWLNPKQAPVFLQTIEKFQREQSMKNLVVDLKIPLTTSMGEATTLHDQLAGKKALLVDFWASWCVPCLQLMPALKKKAEHLSAHGVVVAGINKDDENAEAKAESLRKELDTTMPWLVEPADRPYTKVLEANDMPRVVLLTPEGKVLFNGHPEDPELWTALKKIDAAIEPPAAN
ncbi:MAG: TlpA family protein disulfide reductase [Prosthecobacter sp.]